MLYMNRIIKKRARKYIEERSVARVFIGTYTLYPHHFFQLSTCYTLSLQCHMNFLKKNYELLLASVVFVAILGTHYPFYKAIILMLEFIVIIEVVKMIAEFMEKKRLRLRYVIDIFIIFLTRDVIILTTDPNKEHKEILFLLLVIFVFFLFRILAVLFSPALSKKKKEQK